MKTLQISVLALLLSCTNLLYGQNLSYNIAMRNSLTKDYNFSEQFDHTLEPNEISETKGEPWDGGFFLDGVFGTGTMTTTNPNNSSIFGSSVPVFGASIRLGSKWYFGDGAKFKPGFQIVWLRLGTLARLDALINSTQTSILTAAPLNVGSTNLLMFNDKIGLEMNFNIGLNSNISFTEVSAGNQTLLQFGLLINPAVKFRYKKFAVGIDLTYTHNLPGTIYQSANPPAAYPFTTGVVLTSITVGVKF